MSWIQATYILSIRQHVVPWSECGFYFSNAGSRYCFYVNDLHVEIAMFTSTGQSGGSGGTSGGGHG